MFVGGNFDTVVALVVAELITLDLQVGFYFFEFITLGFQLVLAGTEACLQSIKLLFAFIGAHDCILNAHDADLDDCSGWSAGAGSAARGSTCYLANGRYRKENA